MADSDPLSLIDADLDHLRSAVIAEGERQTGLRNRNPVGVLRGIWETVALIVRRIYTGHIGAMYRASDRAAATGPWLDMHGLYLGVPRKAATVAEGRATAISPATTVTIASGAELVASALKQRFVVTEETVAPAGVAVPVPVRAAAVGAAGNIAPGSSVAADAYPDVTFSLAPDWLTQPGTDQETDDALRRRIDDRWASLGDGYPPAQYRYLAESVAGVKRAVIVRAPRGFGTADVIVAAEGGAGVPSPELLDQVRAALEDRRMLCRDMRIEGGAIVPIHIEVYFEGGGWSASQIESAIKQGMDNAVEGGVIQAADIYAAASARLPGLEYFGVAAPLSDVFLGPASVPDITVIARMGRAPAVHVPGGGSTTGGGAQPAITDDLPYGKLSGALVPQVPQPPVASGRWVVTLPGLASGETWYIGPFAAGTALAGIESYSMDITADWTQRADGRWIYRAASTVPPGVEMDIKVTARRAE